MLQPPKAPKTSSTDDLPDADKLEVGRRIKQHRERHRWTLDELSQATKHVDPQQAGVSKVSISRYENADSYPGYREIKLIAQALGEPITHFFYGDRPDPFSGWHMSLDDYLRHIIKDVLIEEGLVAGQSISDKESQKMVGMADINHRRQRLRPSRDPAERAAKATQQAADLDELERSAVELDKAMGVSGKQTKINQK
ncbi:helix-turn-helix domain-containing protein [Massilia sp. CCM 8695]|uniref:Helix-turn-helix domain-containing protein n=1 Tax=Massilia frigida TaxID=2609281 RepID=A0ABX0NF75_9BURK|nr:helix-turn-helix transcriptional regulator [Massilia frigida]NHZ83799.1 helix-turn-helix domain-containing protein [Massilia frigida]